MAVRVGINGFGRMGRLAMRVAWDWPDIEFVHVNEPAGAAETAAHLLRYDSVHGIWSKETRGYKNGARQVLEVDGHKLNYSSDYDLETTPWADSGVELLLECSGKYKSAQALQPCFEHGLKKVVVSAPIKDGTPNVVVGVNEDRYVPNRDRIVTAASCTTNCLAPVVDVIHRSFGIRHGCITTIHDITNTQSVLDEYHKDLRRARASGLSLIPTTTGSATAITEIFPELRDRLNGIAVRVPLANASLTDCVFEVEKPTTAAEVNAALESAANGRLEGIMGYETRPLVSVDYVNDPRSSVIDAASTMVVNQTQVKVLAWYDNEFGYVNRLMELARIAAQHL